MHIRTYTGVEEIAITGKQFISCTRAVVLLQASTYVCCSISCRGTVEVSWPQLPEGYLSESVALPVNHCIPAGLLPSCGIDAIEHSCSQTLLRLMQENHQLYAQNGLLHSNTLTLARTVLFLDWGKICIPRDWLLNINNQLPLGSQLHYITLVAIVLVHTS